MVGKIMGGIPKSLTAKQEQMFVDYDARRLGEGRKLTDKQLAEWGSLYSRKNAKCVLTDGAKKELTKIVYQTLIKRSSRLKNKYLDKGIQVEDNSITTLSNVFGKLLIKNKVRKENDFFSGECDINKNEIIDIKSSWSFETFPMHDDVIKTSGYEWQLDCYMDLYGVKKSRLAYVLENTPHALLEGDIKKNHYNYSLFDGNGNILNDEAKDFVVELVCNQIFTTKGLIDFCNYSSLIELDWFEGVFIEIPEEMRVKIFEHPYDPKRIALIKEMIGLAREYMNEVLMSIPDNFKRLTELKNSLVA